MIMDTFYDAKKIDEIKNSQLVIDVNILTSCFSNKDYFKSFLSVFSGNSFLIDPIVQLEFYRGTFQEKLYKEKQQFFEFEKFQTMIDHQEIYKKVYENALTISRIYSHKGNGSVPLGDILIISRLMVYSHLLFVTCDGSDFTTLLFDRLAIVSIEKLSKDKKRVIVEHIHVLNFNREKFERCKSELPK